MRIITKYLTEESELPLFKQMFSDIRKKIKSIKQDMSEKAVVKIAKKLKKDLIDKGYTVKSISIKLGRFRGHQYITSAKLFIANKKQFKDINDKKVVELLDYLKSNYSQKFKLKSVEDGIAHFNVR